MIDNLPASPGDFVSRAGKTGDFRFNFLRSKTYVAIITKGSL